jgi:hypothetical protein
LRSHLRLLSGLQAHRVGQFAPLNMQEARYQFSGHAQIADARVVRTTGDAKRFGTARQQYDQSPLQKKGLDSHSFTS